MQLILKNLTKSFDNKSILENFSYEFPDIGIFALLGESGSGKTTLLRMIAGLDSSYDGEIQGGGIKNVSFAFQEYRLFPELTALENAVIANGDKEDTNLSSKAKKILLTLGFTEDDLELLPRELSGGMKQRVSITRAFLKNTPILLLDEPTKELDENIRRTLYEMIRAEAKKRLVIIVSHQSEDLEELKAIKIKI